MFDKTKYKTCTLRHVVDQHKIVTLLQQLSEVVQHVNICIIIPKTDFTVKISVLTCTIELQGTVDRIDWTVIDRGPWKHWNCCKCIKWQTHFINYLYTQK